MKYWFVLILCFFESISFAQDEVYFTQQLRDGPVSLDITVYIPLRERSAPYVVAINSDQRSVLNANLPQYLFRRGNQPRFEVEWLPVAGHEPLLRIEAFDARNEDASFMFLLLSPTEPRTPRHDFEFMWSGRRASLEVGEMLEVIDLDHDGEEEIVVSVQDPWTRFCGEGNVRLAPRVWDYRAMRFRSVSIIPTFELTSEFFSAEVGQTEDLFSNDAQIESVSSDGASPLPQSQGPAPNSLYDQDISTGWIEGSPGVGEGQFLSGDVLEETGLFGFSIFNGIEDGPAGPVEVLLSTENAQYGVRLAARGWQTFWFPEESTSRCFSLLILSTGEENTVGIAEFRPLTQLDRRPLDRALRILLIPMLYENAGRLRQAVISRLISSAGSEALPHLAELMLDADSEEQALLVTVIARIDGGFELLLSLFAESLLDQPAISAMTRSFPTGNHELSDLLLRNLEQAQESEKTALLQLLTTVISPEDAPRLIAWAGQGDERFRRHLVEALASTPIEEVETLAVALGENELSDEDILRSIIRIQRRDPNEIIVFSQDAQDSLYEATQSVNGTVARLAIATIGRYKIDSMRDTLILFAENDVEPNIRAESLEALSRLSESSNAILLEALLDESPTVRAAAAEYLAVETLSPDQWDRVFAVLESETWPGIRRSLMRSTIDYADPEINNRLMDYLENASERDLNSALRLFQTRGVGPDGARFADLIDSLEDPSLRETAIEALSTFRDPVLQQWLCETLRTANRNDPVLTTMIESVGRMQASDGWELVENYLFDSDPQLRRSAIRAFSFFPDERTLQALRQLQMMEENPDLLQLLDDLIQLHENTSNWRMAPR